MLWALAFHPDQIITDRRTGKSRLAQKPMDMTESCLPAARAQGWIVLAKDSDLIDAPVPVENNEQSNPRRIVDHGEQ